MYGNNYNYFKIYLSNLLNKIAAFPAFHFPNCDFFSAKLLPISDIADMKTEWQIRY